MGDSSYSIYGVRLRSQLDLDFAESPPTQIPGPEIRLSRLEPSLLSDRLDGQACRSDVGGWMTWAILRDRSVYLKWDGLAEFLVSADGTEVCCCEAPHAAFESIKTYLLGQALSFALLRQGIEP